ncbi:MAG: transposase [Verrucomicrobiales bacterium]
MIKLLLEAKTLKDRERDDGRCVEETMRLADWSVATLRFWTRVTYSIPSERRPGQRGDLYGKPLNMLNRFLDRHLEVMAFLIYGVPFDNNQAERDLRMMKIKQKISGCFRNLDQAQAFAALHSIISSAKKQTIKCSADPPGNTLESPESTRNASRLVNGYKLFEDTHYDLVLHQTRICPSAE